jgi:hypothetical protein
MNESQTQEMKNINMYACAGMLDTVALALSALIRSCRSKKSREELIDYAHAWNVEKHPDFII